MSERKVLVGYYVERTWRTPPHKGETLVASLRTIYPTMDDAIIAAVQEQRIDDRYTYAGVAVWKVIHE